MGRTEWEMTVLANDIIIIRPRDRKIKRSPKMLFFEDFEQKGVKMLIQCLTP